MSEKEIVIGAGAGIAGAVAGGLIGYQLGHRLSLRELIQGYKAGQFGDEEMIRLFYQTQFGIDPSPEELTFQLNALIRDGFTNWFLNSYRASETNHKQFL